MERLSIHKTWKMYVGGAFVRSESGRVYPVHESSGKASQPGEFMGNACSATRKDLRNAVETADKAFSGWSARSAFNRGQILYRLGEMMESRATELADLLRRSRGVSAAAAGREISTAVDRILYHAGWADKYQQVLGSTNPVASPYFNFTVTEPMGVIGVIASDDAPLLGLIQQFIPAVVSGNTVVALASERHPAPAILLGEILAVSDFPGGVVNLLTGIRRDLLGTFATHEQIRGLDFVLSEEEAREVEAGAAGSIKRCHWREGDEKQLYAPEAESVYEIRRFIEFKTTWHPHWV
jgi:acyl-CoA reductase-like NAD-dependent aldehyde dehydrogenase